MNPQLKRYLKRSALKKNRFVGIWRRFGNPSLEEWTDYLRTHGGFHDIGPNCAINPSVVFTDPHMTKIGTNVRIAGGMIYGHDGSVNMVNIAFKTKYDAVGPVIINDNVFIGTGSIILPGTVIESYTIIGAGSVVAGRVAGEGVYAGNPLRFIRSMQDHISILERRNKMYPWRDIIVSRDGAYDPTLEVELRQKRVEYFFRQMSDPD